MFSPLSLKRFLLSLLEERAPSIVNCVRAIRNRGRYRRRFSALHAEIRRQLFPNDSPITVQRGPFQGLRYFDEIVWGSITPKWLGSYEAELHAIIDNIATRSYDTIIDIGSAEGYYTVGLAVIIPSAKVIAFDTDFMSRRQVRRLARLNEVADRIQIGAYCNHSDLDALSKGRTLVVCDIEGSEANLLDPAIAVSLRRSNILVEVHETCGSSNAIEALIHCRFRASHRIQRIVANGRNAWIVENCQYLTRTIPHATLLKATDENRSNGWVWLWMEVNKD